MKKYVYIIRLRDHEMIADTLKEASEKINDYFTYNLVTPNMIYNLVKRPPSKRPAIPGMSVSQILRKDLAEHSHYDPLCAHPSPSHPPDQHTCC